VDIPLKKAMAARRSRAARRLAVLAAVAIVLCKLAAPAFVPSPRAQAPNAAVAAATLATAGATIPQPAQAIELTYDGFGAPELVAIFLPWVFAIPAYTEWLMQQPWKEEDIKGVATLGKTYDGVGDEEYFRRSPENG